VFWWLWAVLGDEKQTQSQLAPRPALGVEKTKPIRQEGIAGKVLGAE